LTTHYGCSYQTRYILKLKSTVNNSSHKIKKLTVKKFQSETKITQPLAKTTACERTLAVALMISSQY